MLQLLEIIIENDSILTKKENIFNIILDELRKLKYINNKRINIFFSLKDEINDYNIVGIDDSVCNIYSYLNLDKGDFSIEILNKTCQLLIHLFEQKQWNVEDLKIIYQDLEKNNLQKQLPYFKKKFNKNRTRSIEIIINYQEEYAEFIFRVQNNEKKLICERVLFRYKINPLLFNRFITRGEWEENYFVISDQLNEISLVINSENCTYKEEFFPNNNSIEVLQGYLKALDYRTDDKESLILLSR